MADITTFNQLADLTGKESIPALDPVTGAPIQIELEQIGSYTEARRKPKVWPVQETLSTFESTTTWSNVGAGSLTFNQIDPQYGPDTAVLTTDGLGGISIVRANVLDAPHSSVGKHFGLTVRIDDLSKIDGIRLDLGTGGLSDRITFTDILGSQGVRSIIDGEFVTFTLPLINPNSVAGVFDPAVVDAFQLRFTDANAGSTTVLLERIFFFDAVPPTSILTSDDGHLAWYTLAKPLLDKYDALTTIFGIQRHHDPLHPSYDAGISASRMTEAHLQRFIEQGHELGYHEIGNSIRVAPWTPALVVQSIQDYKKWAYNTFGVDVTSAAYPGGEHGTFDSDPSTTVREVFEDHFAIGRTINRVRPETNPAGHRALIRVYGYIFGVGTETMTTVDSQARIDEIVLGGGAIVWSFHNIIDGPATVGTEYPLADLEIILQQLQASAIGPAPAMKIGTMRDLFRE